MDSVITVDGKPVRATVTWSESQHLPSRAWNEALAAKRKGEDTFEHLAHQAQNSPRNHKHASDTEA